MLGLAGNCSERFWVCNNVLQTASTAVIHLVLYVGSCPNQKHKRALAQALTPSRWCLACRSSELAT
eukprot:6106889-Alexandrium_andersonii.AAC.1